MFRRISADNQDMSLFLFRPFRKPGLSTTLRMTVCPPDVCAPRDSLWSSTLRWLAGGEIDQASPRTPLERARGEFVCAMDGLLDAGTTDLLSRAQHARSLRELWHLRPELYMAIARRSGQGQADVRLARVNHHFPTRAQRMSNPVTESADAQ
ncbi:MAG: hypothetical protein ABW032_07435 [Burkholderiaceae bacterium]